MQYRTDQRIKNNKNDMYHAHNLEEKLKPEMSVKPSALWQRRQVSYFSVYLIIL